jgi:pimeloyl-ACP methyl ester carboxylesterase
MHVERDGSGRPLLLLHGLGSSARVWNPVRPALAAHRLVIAPDLPGFGNTPPPDAPPSFEALADAVEALLDREGLNGTDAVGLSLGGQLVLELSRRGRLGQVVALSPGGFWAGWERAAIGARLGTALQLARLCAPALPALSATPAGRGVLMAQFMARPWDAPPLELVEELRCQIGSPWTEPMLRQLLVAPMQPGAEGRGLLIGWGRWDRVCFPWQAIRAREAFPAAHFQWFAASGHYSPWDEPEAVVRAILRHTA